MLVGHSDGGSIAALYGNPRVQATILVAPHSFVEEQMLAGIREAEAAFERGELLPKLARLHGAKARSVFQSWRGVWLDPRFRGWNASTAVEKLTVPTLLIQGLNDGYGTLAQVEYIRSRAA
jgi:pimeloyl-ACP methyl ester carboxylesterase